MVGNALFISKSASILLSWGHLNGVTYENPLEAEKDLVVRFIVCEIIRNGQRFFESMHQGLVRRWIACSEVVGHYFQQLLRINWK